MIGFLLTLLPWILLALSIVVSVMLVKSLRSEKTKRLAADKKLEKIKLNIEQLTDYNSTDKRIKESSEKNIKEFKEAKTDEKVKQKFEKINSSFNSIYYGD